MIITISLYYTTRFTWTDIRGRWRWSDGKNGNRRRPDARHHTCEEAAGRPVGRFLRYGEGLIGVESGEP
jgi:hypothetical protein